MTSLLLSLEVESLGVRITMDALNDGEEARLRAWLNDQPQLQRILRAATLANELAEQGDQRRRKAA
jgi:hypothetical protein